MRCPGPPMRSPRDTPPPEHTTPASTSTTFGWRPDNVGHSPPQGSSVQAFSLRMQFERLHTNGWTELPPLQSSPDVHR